MKRYTDSPAFEKILAQARKQRRELAKITSEINSTNIKVTANKVRIYMRNDKKTFFVPSEISCNLNISYPVVFDSFLFLKTKNIVQLSKHGWHLVERKQ
ncbi:MAG: hypothetical protein COW26_03920 [Nitrosopumilales archaeon CG15_BIG_FIL_POST_REV_8_21_14_020_33_23]|nr:MAG: hypothetical protein COW26_03920 [Nitrosopumilales archaeon CG15_BIG_FIL_POST_REV_8_21_14_020_33_23]PIY90296.1 MAG: hypothetical protein COY74_02225 [Nitrosopumilales archaeon CG_4_10_14_0_8_um_filter_34_8]PJB96878.1 MAG: hypothetical protein CO079_08910 [Nitrosopumilales archaeon CG_4_9_14_0_8_um_filter_34_10]